MVESGLFITLEGTDGSGLSTQTERLVAWFRANERPVFATKEPSGGPVGLLLRLALTHRLGRSDAETFHPLDEQTMGLLFAADRMDHLASEVRPRLQQGVHVVCDRYLLSTYAYQGLEADLTWLRGLNAPALHPDLTILLDVPPSVSVERMQGRGSVERYERLETLTHIHAAFQRLVPLLQAEGQRIVVIDGTATVEAVHTAIVNAVAAL